MKSSTWMTMMPMTSWLSYHTNTDWSSANRWPPNCCNSSWTLTYQRRPASARPYGHFFKSQSLSVCASLGGCMYSSRLIGIPWRYADFMSIEHKFHLFDANTLRKHRSDSFWHVGLSLRSSLVFSSNPRATRRALRTMSLPLTFSVHTHRVEIRGWPTSHTSTYVSISIHFCNSCCLAWSKRGLVDDVAWSTCSDLPGLLWSRSLASARGIGVGGVLKFGSGLLLLSALEVDFAGLVASGGVLKLGSGGISDTVEACWAHNPEVRRSKLRSATTVKGD